MSPFSRWPKGSAARASAEANVHLRRIDRIIVAAGLRHFGKLLILSIVLSGTATLLTVLEWLGVVTL